MSALSSTQLSSLNGSIAGTTGSSSASTSSSSAVTQTDAAGTQQQFLKLLTTQLQNQDPLNPMDNAQLTSQIAQINTVSGIATLNTSVTALSNQFMQMQALQSASLVGKDVVVPGNQLNVENNTGEGAFSLDTPAKEVKVDIINSSGVVVGSMNLGAQKAGQQTFQWPTGSVDTSNGLTFKVTASDGTNALTPTLLMTDRVVAINTSGDTLQLELQKAGTVPYSSVKALN